MDTKINLLFDGTIIVDQFKKKTSSRSGVFFVALNMLKYFLKDSRYNISLCVFRENYSRAQRIMHFLPKKLEIIAIYNENAPAKNIESHKYRMRTSEGMIEKALWCLKIIKNLLKLPWYKYFSNNAYILKNFNVFLSPLYDRISDEIRKYPHIMQFILIHDVILFLNLSCYEDYRDDNAPLHNIFKNHSNDYYFFVSENSKWDFIRYADGRVDEKNMLVTYIASANNFIPVYDKERLFFVLKKHGIDFNQKSKYIFSFCSLEPRKNLIFTINCFIKFIQKNNIDDLYFLLGGAVWDRYKDIYLNETDNISNEYKNKIIHMGYVDDADVNILYSNSLFFAYISKYEGFGMPPLEAMQSGTPVITSNNSSLPEVVGEAAIMIDCESEEQCIKAFEALYYNENLRKDYIKKGIERAKFFTWEKAVNKMSNAIISEVSH
jgi:glycosyltransferase involved in cell wall biosynthesis